MTSVRKYYQDVLNLLPCKFKCSFVTEDLVLKLLKDVNIDKAAGIFLKDAANILAKPISEICNLSDCKIKALI